MLYDHEIKVIFAHRYNTIISPKELAMKRKQYVIFANENDI